MRVETEVSECKETWLNQNKKKMKTPFLMAFLKKKKKTERERVLFFGFYAVFKAN
ncbi:hypothetical protein ID0436_12630 [Helicobacter pylori]